MAGPATRTVLSDTLSPRDDEGCDREGCDRGKRARVGGKEEAGIRVATGRSACTSRGSPTSANENHGCSLCKQLKCTKLHKVTSVIKY
jgi:hypothetical protein